MAKASPTTFGRRLAALALMLVVAGLPCSGLGQSVLAEGLRPPQAPRPILCVGDSLTFGEGGNGVTYPGVLSSLAHVPTVNLGLSGWIPRHIVYYVLLHETPFLSIEQLRGIPPSEYENRVHQPGINALRTFLVPGQTIWVGDERKTEVPPVQYRWDPDDTQDDPGTIKPLAVRDSTHRPFTATGRWRKTSATSGPDKPTLYSGIILCVGANGMEADDIHRSLRTLIELLQPPDGHFLILNLINRADPDRDQEPKMVESWAKWIAECNATIRSDYPGQFLDLQAWFTSSGPYQGRGYRTQDWVKSATPEELALDSRYQAMGVLPHCVRTPGNATHLNAIGYSIVGTLAYEWIVLHGWLGTGVHTPADHQQGHM